MVKPELWHKRHAINIVGQLPEDPDDALQILKLARKFVVEFMLEKASQAELEPDKRPF